MNKLYYSSHEDIVKISVFDITANYLGPMIERYNSTVDEIFFTRSRIKQYTDNRVAELDELLEQWYGSVGLHGWGEI